LVKKKSGETDRRTGFKGTGPNYTQKKKSNVKGRTQFLSKKTRDTDKRRLWGKREGNLGKQKGGSPRETLVKEVTVTTC